jgi:gentisate 1,2-dioxygenase
MHVIDNKKLDREQFYRQLDSLSMAPLWESLHQLVPRTPTTAIKPAYWDFDSVVRDQLLEAGKLITAREAERRVLILENPGLRGKASITDTLYAGFQLILPGEVAPAHRHTQSALRFVIEGRGAYTSVEGERTLMFPGDLIITPSWTWHEHGNDTDAPMIWLDGLDIPLIRSLASGFSESGRSESKALNRPLGDSPVRFGRNLLPIDWQPSTRNSPVFNYPYERTREVLGAMAKSDAPDSCHAHKLRYSNPATGGSPMQTIGAFAQWLPAGFATEEYYSTDSTVFVAVEGHGDSVIGDQTFSWKPRDVFVAPSWVAQRHLAAADAILFSFSDRPVQQALGVWREHRGPRS